MNRIFGTAILSLLMAGTMVAGAAKQAAAADKVSIGVVNSSSDVGLFIADAKGYFKNENIEASFMTFDSAAKMIAPLAAGQLDVGGGAASSGLYNAVERGLKIKIVADKARNAPGYGFQALLVRKALIDDGSVKGIGDLKGRKLAIVAAASSDASVLNEAMKSAGFKYSDADPVYLGFPQHCVAFQNGAIDASITTEPTVSQCVRLGVAIRLMGNDAFYSNAQTAVILYSGAFATERPEVAKRFIRAYIRALRDYVDALKDGHIAGKGADDIVAILTRYSNAKDADMVRSMTAHSSDPDGLPNVDSLKKDWAFFQAQGQVSGKVTVDQVVDLSFVRAAVKELGPYAPGGR
jgi:NitT/TauT family transport system substrate-binding protein